VIVQSDDWCFIPERQDLSCTSIFRLALDIGRILYKSKSKEKTVIIYLYIYKNIQSPAGIPNT